MKKEDYLKPEFIVLAKMNQIDHELSTLGLIESAICRRENSKTIKDEFYFIIKIIDDNEKLVHFIDIIHRKNEKNIIIKLSYNFRYIVDVRIAEDLSEKEFRKRRVWYCPIDKAKEIKSIREILDHIAEQFRGGK